MVNDFDIDYYLEQANILLSIIDLYE